LAPAQNGRKMARSRAKDYDDKRLLILQRSAELFAVSGYVGTSMNMVAEACSVSKALLYHYYPDKEAILFDVLFAHLTKLVSVTEDAVESTVPSKRFHVIVATLLETYRHADAEHQVQISSLKLLPKEKQEPLLVMERALVKTLSEALAVALPNLDHKRLLKPLTMSVFGMLNWHYMWFREGGTMTRGEYADFVVRLVLAGAPEAAAALTGAAKPTTAKSSQKELLS
jgi:AcrR family transcriptional regulator